MDRCFDYALPEALASACPVGTVVRVPLQGRRVRGWVVARPGEAPPGVALREVREVLAPGPAAEVVDLARYGAWRYAGRLRPFLVAASARRLVDAQVLPRRDGTRPALAPGVDEVAGAVREALALRSAVLRLPPASARLPVVTEVLAALTAGDLLVLVPEHRDVEMLVSRLARLQVATARHPEQWGAAAGGGRVVVGTRTGALAPVGELGAVVVLDAHAEAYTEERAPTWNAVVLARERARRAGVPFLAVSSCPTLELLAADPLVRLPPALERSRWPAVEVVDRRGEDPRTGGYSPRLAPAIAAARERDPTRPVLCVLNRTGRARRLACAACGELARCEACGAALAQLQAPLPGAAGVLTCPACARERPVVCAACGGGRLKLLRVGVLRAGEELAALTGLTVATCSGPDSGEPLLDTAVLVGTEALLHRVGRSPLVVFLDFDLELLGSRLRAAEHALELLARAGRLVGGRPVGRVLVQTRCPSHEVLEAAVSGDPGRFAEPEAERRRLLGLPPFRALALVTGAEASAFAAAAAARGAEVAETAPGRFLLRSSGDYQLAQLLERPSEGPYDVRVEVDPLRL
ncbi:MAG: priA [Acidimicrobiaceae bacterium]|nr:priA [Acidimicrobiaceae bacterium]